MNAEAERLRSSLLASISHDLRTPLAVIAGCASSLVEAGERMQADDRTELARSIYGEARHVSDLVNNILDMTRLEAGEVRLNLQWVSLEETAGSVMQRIESRPGGAGVGNAARIELDIDPALPLLRLDPMLIEQLLTNLIENALKFAPGDSPIEVRARAAGDTILISVADHGPGIHAGDEERVFNKFYRGQREGAIGGAGLGLTICRAIVAAHGGHIEARSRTDSTGAIFSVALPRGEGPPAVAPEAGE